MITRSKLNFDNLPQIVLSNVAINRADSARNLGIWFDTRLDWSVHITKLCGKVYGCLRRLWKIAWAVSKDTKLMLVRSLILPFFLYGYPVFSAISSSLSTKLQQCFNACVRFICGLRKYDHLGDNADIILKCPLSKYYDKLICTTLHKIIHTKSPRYLFTKLNFMQSQRTKKLKSVPRRLSSYDSMFFIKSISLWNSLPLELRLTPNASKFKQNLNAYYALHQYN